MFHKFFYQIKDKINLKFKTSDDLNFYEIGPWCIKQGSKLTTWWKPEKVRESGLKASKTG